MSESILIALVGSTAFTAIVTIIGNIIMWCLNRKANRRDKQDGLNEEIKTLKTQIQTLITESQNVKELTDKQYNELIELIQKCIETNQVQAEGIRTLIRNSILHIYYKYLPWGAMPVYERENLSKLTDIYLNSLHGNSFVKDITHEMDAWLTVKSLDYFCDENKIIK